jgi:hypothetical protein
VFAAFTADVDLNAQLQVRQVAQALLRQPLRNTKAIHALHPVEMFGDERVLLL